MPKPQIDNSGLFKLCRAFLTAANAQSEGRIFRAWPHMRPDEHSDERVLADLKSLFSNSYFASHFPALGDQDAVAKQAMEAAGVTFDSLKNTLKKEGLGEMVTILGRVARLG